MPATALAAGQRPPQFVVVSFDGSGWHPLWQHWLDVSRRAGAHLSFFVSGVYLVPADRAAQLYHPPGHAAGSSSIGFSTVPDIKVQLEDMRAALTAGHELGTHFNGHFCGANGVDRWTAADWGSELAQFDAFVDDWPSHLGASAAAGVAGLPFAGRDTVGGRTPCLEGGTGPLLAAERAAGFRYDASRTGTQSWPVKLDGLWEFPLPSVPLAGTARQVLAMDYNFYFSQSGAQPAAAAVRPKLQAQVLASYRGAFNAAYWGGRAPLILGDHFNRWNGGIYTQALTDFVLETCGRPDVRCVSFRELADWLDAQPPVTLARLQSLPPA